MNFCRALVANLPDDEYRKLLGEGLHADLRELDSERYAAVMDEITDENQQQLTPEAKAKREASWRFEQPQPGERGQRIASGPKAVSS